jgi:phenylacetate-CoA ligase
VLRALAYWAMLQRLQWYGVDKLLKIQDRRIRKLLNHAVKEVEFYRKLYSSTTISEDDSGLELLNRSPVVTRKMLAETPLEKRTANSVNLNKTLKRTTAGSTGIPIEILETKSSAAYWVALYLRRLWAWGVRPEDKILRLLPAVPAGSINYFMRRTLLDKNIKLVDLQQGIDTSLLSKISKYGVNVLISNPSTLLAILKKMEESNNTLSFKLVLTTGEILTPLMRKTIQDKLNCEVYDSYSTVELGNIAWECPTHTAYHINIDSVVLELNNPRRMGRSLTEGEAVGTCLYRYATPIIRYFIGDVVRLRDDECSCGRGLPLLESVQGRLVDYIVARDGVFISPYVLTTAMQKIEGIKQFKIIQHPDYVVEVQAIAANRTDLEKLNSAIETVLTPFLHGLHLKVRFTESIEVGSAKFRLVESLVPK